MAAEFSFEGMLRDVGRIDEEHNYQMYRAVTHYGSRHPLYPWSPTMAKADDQSSFDDIEAEMSNLWAVVTSEITENPFHIPYKTLFAGSSAEAKEMENTSATLMKMHANIPISPLRVTLYNNLGVRSTTMDMAHLDQVRRARRHGYLFLRGYLRDEDVEDIIHPFLNGTNREELQLAQKTEITSHQAATCDSILLFCFKLFHFFGGRDFWDKTTSYQRRVLYQATYREMSLAIDRKLYKKEAHIVNINGIHANKSCKLAEVYRHLCEYKFIRLMDATMNFRVWKFWNWKEPVYNIFKTIALDDTLTAMGVSKDVEDVPGVTRGATAVNSRPLPVYTSGGSFNFKTLR